MERGNTMKINLPVTLNPISRRKDKSVKLSFETRELQSDEILTLMSLEGSEMWACLATNEDEIEVPEERAEVEGKTQAQRIRAVLYILYKQDTERGKFVGTFESYYQEKTEKYIEHLKQKIDA